MNLTRTLPCCLTLLTWLAATPVGAHEFWLAPETFTLSADQPVQANIRIGQHFKGDSFVYRPSQIETLNLQQGKTVTTVPAKLGDLPAINIKPVGTGLNILTLSSALFTVTYYEPEKFPDFVRKEGLEWALKAHQQRNLPDTHFTEAYRRHAKSLLKVGDGLGNDRRTGMPFEWVMITNPYTSHVDPVVQLWWRDNVAANAQCRLFVRNGTQVQEHVLRTDSAGKVTLPRTPGATYLLNAVRIMIPDAAAAAETQAVWETRWASLTFATPTD